MIKKVVLLLMVLLCVSGVYAVGLSGKQLVYHITYDSGMIKTFDYRVKSTVDVTMNHTLYAEGDMAKYIRFQPSLIRDLAPGGTEWFTAILELPEKDDFKPGTHTIYIGIMEERGEGGGPTKARTGIRTRIVVRVLVDGKAVIAGINSPEIAHKETAQFKFNIENVGKERINSVIGEIQINGSNYTARTTEVLLLGGTSTKLTALYDTYDIGPGVHGTRGRVLWDNKITPINGVIKIGTKDIEVVDHTFNFEAEKINPFIVQVKSRWNRKIKNVYTKVTVGNDIISSPLFDLDPWQALNITSYWKPTLPVGEYQGKLEIFFEGESKEMHINVKVEEKINAQIQTPLSHGLTTLQFVIILLAIFGVNIIVWFVLFRKKEKRGKKKK